MPSKKLVITDWDGVAYAFSDPVYFDMKKCFAAAARTLSLDVTPDALEMAMRSWDMHEDATTLFAEQYGICPVTLHRYAHRIFNTALWTPHTGLRESFAALQEQAHIIVWTHGSKNMVLGNLDRVGLYGLIHEKDVFDMHMIGRKDREIAPYLRICDAYGVDPSNACLIEDSFKNLVWAKKAGLNTALVMPLKPEQDSQIVDFAADSTVDTYNVIAKHLSQVHDGSHKIEKGGSYKARLPIVAKPQ